MVVRYLEQGGGVASEGLRKLIPCVEKTPVAAGVDGIFVKVHDDPLSSPVDGPTQWPLRHFEELLEELIAIAVWGIRSPQLRSPSNQPASMETQHHSSSPAPPEATNGAPAPDPAASTEHTVSCEARGITLVLPYERRDRKRGEPKNLCGND
ncbi:hypothetical protein Vadar_004245 [Vaccinium darrowii]|uniref:Uncharacterized protein n=1 Tax=Vaccinium darrowii TaxID=229202 RepID=A0ACB7YV02_9ERIC|nr:hypothetical protein Vadar_004245 [Vaccinium darrowii]